MKNKHERNKMKLDEKKTTRNEREKMKMENKHKHTNTQTHKHTNTGCPNLSTAFYYNKKKHIIEFALQQNRSAAGRMIGSIVVRVNELGKINKHE